MVSLFIFLSSVLLSIISLPSLVFKAFHLDTRSRLVVSGEPVENALHGILTEMEQRIENKLELGSDWVYRSLEHMDVLFLRYRYV